jgi:hypothetical protein
LLVVVTNEALISGQQLLAPGEFGISDNVMSDGFV